MYIFVPGSTFNLTAIDHRTSFTGAKLGRGVDEFIAALAASSAKGFGFSDASDLAIARLQRWSVC
ncbi:MULTISPECIES: hypothetical protein [Rhizobium]|jgi:hypothetical protein|uniref:hypothetical protein n=1 Tax=Rhizobium TaxID=379 RepID=UPI0006491E59|nr:MULTISPECIES: hypothetical protein [Rhizobium]NKJ09494.1 hypothetical protein [Rhizobium sp. SG741]NTJ10814.1 hypothetical protein [Rhizobium lusitanum]